LTSGHSVPRPRKFTPRAGPLWILTQRCVRPSQHYRRATFTPLRLLPQRPLRVGRTRSHPMSLVASPTPRASSAIVINIARAVHASPQDEAQRVRVLHTGLRHMRTLPIGRHYSAHACAQRQPPAAGPWATDNRDLGAPVAWPLRHPVLHIGRREHVSAHAGARAYALPETRTHAWPRARRRCSASSGIALSRAAKSEITRTPHADKSSPCIPECGRSAARTRAPRCRGRSSASAPERWRASSAGHDLWSISLARAACQHVCADIGPSEEDPLFAAGCVLVVTVLQSSRSIMDSGSILLPAALTQTYWNPPWIRLRRYLRSVNDRGITAQ
jgi:hypothetical protein